MFIDQQSGGWKELLNLLSQTEDNARVGATDASRELFMLHMLREKVKAADVQGKLLNHDLLFMFSLR